MNIELIWKEKMLFSATDGKHEVEMDAAAPLGRDSSLTPKQMCLASVCGCTAMDVVGLLRKFKQDFKSFSVSVDAPVTDKHPVVFKEIILTYKFTGQVDLEKVKESVHLSQSKYCGVSAMIAKAAPIRYIIEINGKVMAEGKSEFTS